MLEKIEKLMAEIASLAAKNADEAEALRIKYLGKKGEVTNLMNDFRNVPAEQKREFGQKLNVLKTAALNKINELKEAAEVQKNAGSSVDLTRTPYPVSLGSRHPLTIVKNEIVDIFSRLGFTLAEGPEVEDDWHVYSSLNFADDHPARDMQDTFFVESHPDIILRSHTSSVQSRVMETSQPPIRILCPGRVYRNEAVSARAHCFFHQVEGLYIDKNVKIRSADGIVDDPPSLTGSVTGTSAVDQIAVLEKRPDRKAFFKPGKRGLPSDLNQFPVYGGGKFLASLKRRNPQRSCRQSISLYLKRHGNPPADPSGENIRMIW